MNNTIWSSTPSSTTMQGNWAGPSPGNPPSGGPPPGNPPPGGPGGGGGGGPGGGNTAAITNMQRNLALYGYILLFLFGYFGHINTIIIFLRQTLRSVSTSCLFICITISNVIYLSVCIYDFLYTGLGLTPVDSQTNPDLSNALCRLRSFIQTVAMCSSAWLLVTISIDRWIRIRFPFKVNKLCTRKRVLFGALIILICAIILNSHLLLPSLGTLPGVTICGPISSSTYSFFFRQVFLSFFVIWKGNIMCLYLSFYRYGVFY
jgi:hypothetical protein